MLEIIGDSRAVARAAIQLAMTATREEETELKASLTEKDIVGAASDFGGTFVDSMMKMIERAVVAAKREGVISDTHREEGAVAGAAHDAVCQVSEKAMGFSVGGKIGVGTGTAMVVSFLTYRRACGGRGVLYRGLSASQRGRRWHGTPGDLTEWV